jgi:hypothetical protein
MLIDLRRAMGYPDASWGYRFSGRIEAATVIGEIG